MKLQELKRALDAVYDNDVQKLCSLVNSHDEILIIGNGGSNAIASHISQDYTKKLGKKSFTFSDPSRLTCYINDYGMEKAYAQFLKEFSREDALVILISSSGNSENILNCASYCLDTGRKFVILTGFSESNKLKKMYGEHAEVSFWVDSCCYGVVECAHQSILHIPA